MKFLILIYWSKFHDNNIFDPGLRQVLDSRDFTRNTETNINLVSFLNKT